MMEPYEPLFLEAGPEECGVFGVYAPGEDVARLAYFGLFALQHRGQESAGIAVATGRAIHAHTQMGLVAQVFTENDLKELTGRAAIGHTRYSTMGSSNPENAQPIVVKTAHGPFALGHNGNLVNALHLSHQLADSGIAREGTTDSEIIVRLIAKECEAADSIEDAIAAVVPHLRGAFTLVMLGPDAVYGLRDPYGFRPLCIGRLNGYHLLASEDCALRVVGAEFVREVEPGELVILNGDGVTSRHVAKPAQKSLCIFEFVYLARPDSSLYGKNVYEVRRRMGQQLAREHPVAADIVIPVPDTGVPAAAGYAEESRIHYREGLIKNRYIHRTFIQPDQRLRELGVRMKLTPLREVLNGRRVVVVEDSIVRGTTTRQIVKLLRDAGAVEIHLRISSPPFKWPCFYGIDTPERDQLLAAQRKSVSAIRDFLGADSLGYLSIRGMVKAVGVHRDNFCTACFSGDYRVPIPNEAHARKAILEHDAAWSETPAPVG